MAQRLSPSSSTSPRSSPVRSDGSLLHRSLKHEYELYIEQEIEDYKESVPRSVLLSIGDEAVAVLATQSQLALTELLLCEEVDRIIFRRLRLPGYDTWRRRRVKLLAELRRPEHWGLRPDDVLVRTVRPSPDGRVLLAGQPGEASTLYLAAIGCEVTAVNAEAESLERVLLAAQAAGLGGRVHTCVGDLASWMPAGELTAVVVTSAALDGLTAAERARIIEILQCATADGGVHLVHTLAAGRAGGRHALSLEELRSRYRGWTISVERDADGGPTNAFLAWKQAS